MFVVGADCLDPAALAGALAKELGREEIDARIHVLVLDTRAEGMAFVIATPDSVSTRVLPVGPEESCEARRRAIVLALAEAIGRAVLAQATAPPPPPPSPAPATPPAAPPVPAAPPASPSERSPADPIQFLVTLRGSALFGASNSPTALVEVALGVRLARWFELHGVGFFSSAARAEITAPALSLPADAQLLTSIAGGRLDGCVPTAPRALQAVGCLGLTVARYAMSGKGLDRDASAAVPWVAPTTRLAARWTPASSLGLELGLGGAAPLLRPTPQIAYRSRSIEIASVPALVGSVDLGVRIIFR